MSVLADHQLPELARLIALELRKTSAPATELLSASDLAKHLGVSPRFVYANADLLGAVRLGTGSKPRLRFDLTVARAALSASAIAEHETVPTPRRRSASTSGAITATELLRERTT